MRVIAGEKRGMVLYSPKDQKVRPTADKVKGAIFNSIQNEISSASVFVDVFGGSGAMGIEALSRGAAEAWFFDCARESIALIKKNVQKAKYEKRAHICHCPAEKGLLLLEKNGIAADVFFLDPPYVKVKETIGLLEIIQGKKLLKKDGIIMIEHDKNDIIPSCIKNFLNIKTKTYGMTCISFYVFGEEAEIDKCERPE